jgi:hypothetical protein
MVQTVRGEERSALVVKDLQTGEETVVAFKAGSD